MVAVVCRKCKRGVTINSAGAGGQQQRGRKAEAAAARAEAAAGSAVLQLRKCCDHPQLTAFWQRHTAELQAHHGMLSTAEQSGRLADFLQNKLQARQPCFIASYVRQGANDL